MPVSRVQQNAVTVQEKMEEALQVFFRKEVVLTGSSRTDTGGARMAELFSF